MRNAWHNAKNIKARREWGKNSFFLTCIKDSKENGSQERELHWTSWKMCSQRWSRNEENELRRENSFNNKRICGLSGFSPVSCCWVVLNKNERSPYDSSRISRTAVMIVSSWQSEGERHANPNKPRTRLNCFSFCASLFNSLLCQFLRDSSLLLHPSFTGTDTLTVYRPLSVYRRKQHNYNCSLVKAYDERADRAGNLAILWTGDQKHSRMSIGYTHSLYQLPVLLDQIYEYICAIVAVRERHWMPWQTRREVQDKTRITLQVNSESNMDRRCTQWLTGQNPLPSCTKHTRGRDTTTEIESLTRNGKDTPRKLGNFQIKRPIRRKHDMNQLCSDTRCPKRTATAIYGASIVSLLSLTMAVWLGLCLAVFDSDDWMKREALRHRTLGEQEREWMRKEEEAVDDDVRSSFFSVLHFVPVFIHFQDESLPHPVLSCSSFS